MFNFIILTNTKIIPSTATGAAAAPCAGAPGWRAASPTEYPARATASAIESGAVATVVAASATGSSDASRATAVRASANASAADGRASVTVTATRAPAQAQRQLGPALGSE